MHQISGKSIAIVAHGADVQELARSDILTTGDASAPGFRTLHSDIRNKIENLIPASVRRGAEPIEASIIDDRRQSGRPFGLGPELPDITLVLLGDRLSKRHDLAGEVRQLLRSSDSPGRAVIVLHTGELPRALKNDPNPRLYAVDAGAGDLLDDLWEALNYVAENVRAHPRVGIGALVIENGGGRFFLQRRLTKPEVDSLGAIGGDLPKGSDINGVLQQMVTATFADRCEPVVGPLLACTTMTDRFYHYLDLSFLVVVDSAHTVREPDSGPAKHVRYRTKYWYSLGEMVDFWNVENEGVRGGESTPRLFPPIRNALEAYLRTVLASRASHGRSDVSVPRLKNELDNIVINQAATLLGGNESFSPMAHAWSHAPLPFFEKHPG